MTGEIKEKLVPLSRLGIGRLSNTLRASHQAEADRDRRFALRERMQGTSRICGDPTPGDSAKDKPPEPWVFPSVSIKRRSNNPHHQLDRLVFGLSNTIDVSA